MQKHSGVRRVGRLVKGAAYRGITLIDRIARWKTMRSCLRRTCASTTTGRGTGSGLRVRARMLVPS